MVENDDQTQQPPERSTPRHSAPQRQQPRQFPQRPQEAMPQPPDPDPLLGQSRAPAPPPPLSQQNAYRPAQQPMQPQPQPGHPPMNQRPIGQPPMGLPPMGQQQNPHAGNGPQAPINSNQNPPGPNQDLYRPIQPGPGQNNPGQQPPYRQRPSQQGQPQQRNPQQSNPQHGQPPAQHSQPPAQYGQPPAQHGQPPSQYGQPVVQHGPPLQQGQPPSQYGPPQQQRQMSQHGQPPYGQSPYGQQQYGQPPQGGNPWQAANGPRLSAGQESPGQYGSDDPGTFGTPRRAGDRAPRLVGALSLLVIAVMTTVWCVSWVWNKADAITPVALPSANGTPLKTVSPYVQPSATPPPSGKVVGSNMVASNNDTMPVLSSAWSDNAENSGLYGGASTWLTVHKNYDGNNTWGNYVAFGGLNKTIPFTNTPAGLRAATGQAASIAIVRLYDKNVKLIGKATHRTISVQGHPGHEVTVKVAVSKPKLKETYSTVAVAVIDRGDGTGMVAVGDFAGSTQQWLPIWRAKVRQITFAR